ncbi:hypothetical protein HHE92_12775 [Pseudoalteromonas arctica]|uniref:Orphan protein n=1 Tax=Pseudoalteromonas arctica TaxID=394751 RepID=A0ABU9TN42_9GAMM|nr:hypothetical protein [Pseudoalteromonas arctica]NMP80673.1 hypothetical protein [Pseudoalteromonas arctica]
MFLEIALLALLLVLVTITYKVLPHRELGNKKPTIAVMPKYKTKVNASISASELDEVLAVYGFSKVNVKNDADKYTRGSVLGDISIKLAKVNVFVSCISPSRKEVCVEAGWVAVFDTGDHWQFLKELSEKLADA